MNVRALIFGLNCAIASVLALLVAFEFELPNPSWSVITVFITSQPIMQGSVWGKAFYRVIGTVVALAVALIVIPNLIDAPELMILVLALWLGGCLYLSLLDRTPRSYTFMLSGYTAILVGLPVITADPSTIFDTAVARTEEILVGVGAAALVHGLFSFHSARATLHAKVQQTLADAKNWLAGALTGSASPQERVARRRLASDISELVNIGMALRFELPELHTRFGVIRTLEDRLIALLPLLAAVESRREALLEFGALDPQLEALAQDASAWVQSSPPSQQGFEDLLQRCAQLTPAVGGDASPKVLLELSLVHRIALLATTWRDCFELARATCEPARRIEPRLAQAVAEATPRRLHIDHGLAIWSALVAALAVGATAAFGMLLEWPPAISSIGLAAVLASLFATFDDPTPLQARFLAWSLLAIPLSAVYVFAILPGIDGFVELALCLFPLYAVLGYFMALPKYALQSLSLFLNITTLMALQPSYRADFVTFATITIAAVSGTVIALELTRLLRVISANVAARRLLRYGWADLAGIARKPLRQTLPQFAMRMLNRLSLLVPRTAVATPTYELRLSDVLRDLQIGFNVSELSAVALQLPEASGGVRALRVRLVEYFDALAVGGAETSQQPCAHHVERVTRELLALPASVERERGLAAAVGLSQNLLSFERAAAAGSET